MTIASIYLSDFTSFYCTIHLPIITLASIRKKAEVRFNPKSVLANISNNPCQQNVVISLTYATSVGQKFKEYMSLLISTQIPDNPAWYK